MFLNIARSLALLRNGTFLGIFKHSAWLARRFVVMPIWQFSLIMNVKWARAWDKEKKNIFEGSSMKHIVCLARSHINKLIKVEKNLVSLRHPCVNYTDYSQVVSCAVCIHRIGNWHPVVLGGEILGSTLKLAPFFTLENVDRFVTEEMDGKEQE